MIEIKYKVGDIVMFRGEQYKIIALGDIPGTFDLWLHPTKSGDSWRNVPPDELLRADRKK